MSKPLVAAVVAAFAMPSAPTAVWPRNVTWMQVILVGDVATPLPTLANRIRARLSLR